MSRISDTRIRTREAAARLVTSGRLAHELTVDLIYAEIRQGSRTTINDELKLWKDEQARNDALAAVLPPAVAKAMLSVWALAVGHGEQVFAQRGDELEAEAAAAITRAGALETAHAELQAEVRTVRAQLDDQQARLATALTEQAQAHAGRDAALVQAEAAVAERDAIRARSEQALRDLQSAHALELEALRTTQAGHEAALRVEVDQATARLEGVQKRVMLQTEVARDAQRRAEAALSEIRKRNEQLVGDVERISADAAEQRRLAERYEKLHDRVTQEARDLRCERDGLAQQVALLQGQLTACEKSPSARRTKVSRPQT
ncbi:plasmid replication DNA-binding protein KfrA [Paraburkholderia sp. BL23I1N1]|uniref:DNA-binding protein n=1 Tax=Paraburkholderia sp. BL23I1N1 TaxID=1938802 RepID=UPI000E735274|nr:DNA-binding protein [Paraburkholderia sp. BL23I1N1]RKE38681.1 plasmid replication DNA-binding protein KfrA [Paraburkholderia sp. BL23I1N1]